MRGAIRRGHYAASAKIRMRHIQNAPEISAGDASRGAGGLAPQVEPQTPVVFPAIHKAGAETGANFLKIILHGLPIRRLRQLQILRATVKPPVLIRRAAVGAENPAAFKVTGAILA